MKKHRYQRPLSGFKPIHMPANTGSGAVISALSLVFGFALIWHMWLLAGVSFFVLVLAAIVHTFNYKRDFYIPATDVIATEEARTLQLARHV
ncbi:Cytochrome bo(3) ubiquinol oxidase subunit 1 [compost metagenome]